MEVVRDRRERVSVLRHARANHMRLLAKSPENDTTEVTYDMYRAGRTVTVREFKTYRRFVQVINGQMRYFKEFGDPRQMDYDTGEFAKEGETIPVENRATEIIHFRQNSDETYGIPRWINQLPSILGSRESEECNLRYFEDNTIPPIIMSVSGGRLTGESFRELKRMVQEEGLGKERQHRVMLVEAVPERESLDDKGNVQIRIDKLTDARQSDGLFKEYDEGNQAKVRSSFRLPPIAVGMSEDHTFASANTASFLVETQVYAPMRKSFDEILNKKLINSPEGLGLRTCKLQSKVPPITNPETIIKSMTALNVMGALTPRMCNKMADGILGTEVPDYPQQGEQGYEEWMDRPIVFITRGIKSQEGQSEKDEDTKEIEDDGNVEPKRPEHGQE